MVFDASSYRWCGCIIILCYTHLKLALLLHKTVLVNFFLRNNVLHHFLKYFWKISFAQFLPIIYFILIQKSILALIKLHIADFDCGTDDDCNNPKGSCKNGKCECKPGWQLQDCNGILLFVSYTGNSKIMLKCG